MTSSQAHCAGDEPVSALSKAYEHFFELNFSTGEFAMSIVKILKQVLVVLLCVLLVEFTAQVDAYGSIGQSNDQPAASPAKQSPHELQQLVAPIALYPDALVAQILAASTYPTQIVEADRWMQGHSNLKGEELAKEVDKQDWDPSVKAVAQFPSVLENMDKKPLLGFVARRCIYQPAAGCDRCGANLASAGPPRWQSERQRTRKSKHAGQHDSH